MSEIALVIADIQEIYTRHRIPFEEKHPVTDLVVQRILEANDRTQEDLLSKDVVNRVRNLPKVFYSDEDKAGIENMLAQSSLNTALLMLSVRIGQFSLV